MSSSLRVAFVHPELGVGGAERLVVDAAMALQAAGHGVTIFTAAHDPARCFDETRNGVLDVRVRGRLLPAHVGQRLRAPAAIARALAAGTAASLPRRRYDVVFCDLVPHVVPLLRRLAGLPVVFYLHYPDLLLTPPRHGWYRWYRAPLDRLEEWALGAADVVLANSRFTAAVARRTFTASALEPQVLHPSVDPSRYPHEPPAADGEIVLLCLGRFDPRKNSVLAVEALADLRSHLSPDVFARLRLVIAGGFDSRLRECAAVRATLERRSRELDLAAQVTLCANPSEAERLALLARCRCLVHTALEEHFGYAPIEAMASARPVVAVAAGGPAETVVDGETGALRPPTAVAFAAALAPLVTDPLLAARLGVAGRERACRLYSHGEFGRRLEEILRAVVAGRRPAATDSSAGEVGA